MDLMSYCAVLGWIALHVLAMAAALGTRVTASPRVEVAAQFCFLAAMVAVGGTAWVSHEQELGLWIPSAVTLVAMVLLAVTDCQGQPLAPANGEPIDATGRCRP